MTLQGTQQLQLVALLHKDRTKTNMIKLIQTPKVLGPRHTGIHFQIKVKYSAHWLERNYMTLKIRKHCRLYFKGPVCATNEFSFSMYKGH